MKKLLSALIIAAFALVCGFAEQKTVTVTTTERIYYYHTKTRTLKSKAQTYKVWSNSSNDTKLIKQGYKYTGTRQEIK